MEHHARCRHRQDAPPTAMLNAPAGPGAHQLVIANETGITPGTAKAHVAHIYKKLGGHSKDEMLELVEERAVRWAEGTK